MISVFGDNGDKFMLGEGYPSWSDYDTEGVMGG